MARTLIQSVLTITAIALLLGTVGCGGGNKTYGRALDGAKASPIGSYTTNNDGSYSPSDTWYLVLGMIAAAAGSWAVAYPRKLKSAQ